ncbi:ABC transporter substrate-binding protein [Cohnella cellulosilytica]|uniref:ABC transporter substrate-binding protein n=1 Tax=Cohnella cellulosilytica TaxID=986710 RepID=A0ABW2FHX6_9BACL
MRKKTNRIAGTTLTLALAVGLLAGCGGNGDKETGKASESPSASAKTSEEAAKPIAMEWLGYDSYGQPNPDSAVIKAVEQKFNAKFDFWYIDSQKWEDNLNVRLAAGEMPDVLKITNRQNLPKYVNQGILAPIPLETIEKHAPTYVKFLNENYPEVWDGVKYNGEIYAIPMTNLNGTYPTVVIWRQDWLEKVGISKVPQTIEEYEEAFVKFRNDDPDGDNKKDTYGLSDFALPNILGAFGYPGITDFKGAAKGDASKSVQFTMKDGNVVLTSIQPEMKEALSVLQRWYKAGLIDPEFITSENTTGYWADSQAFYNSKIGITGMSMFYHWRNEMNPDIADDTGGGQYKAFKESNPNGEAVFGVPAVGPNGASGTPTWDTASHPIAITTKAMEDPAKLELLLQMIEAACTDYEYYLMLTNGEKGVDWKLEGDKFINLTASDTLAEANVKGKNVLNAKVSYDPFLKQRDQFDYAFADEHAKISGYNAVYVPNVEAFSKYSNTLNKLTVDAYFKIITGEAEVDSFDDYVAKFRANGGDELEQAANEAYKQMVGQ